MIAASPNELSDQQLLDSLNRIGLQILRRAQEKQASLGIIMDDDRWSHPFPLRFEAQIQVLLFEALDAYDATVGILGKRASQQAFNTLRFQVESLALIRWVTEPDDDRVRQDRAYRLLRRQLSMWIRTLKEDAHGEQDALEQVARVEAELDELNRLAKADGFEITDAIGRRQLFAGYLKEGNYATFTMYSQLGSHPAALGNALFSFDPESRHSRFDMSDPVARAFWSAVAQMTLVKTLDAAGNAVGWGEWLNEQITVPAEEGAHLIGEALRRWQLRQRGRIKPPRASRDPSGAGGPD